MPASATATSWSPVPEPTPMPPTTCPSITIGRPPFRFVTRSPDWRARASATWSSGALPVATRVVAAVTAFCVAVCWLSTLAPSMRAKASRLPPASTTAMHCGTCISVAFAIAASSTASAPAWVSSREGLTMSRHAGCLRRTPAPCHSQLDLRAQLDDVVRRDAEELRRRARVAREEHEQRPPPARAGSTGRWRRRSRDRGSSSCGRRTSRAPGPPPCAGSPARSASP